MLWAGSVIFLFLPGSGCSFKIKDTEAAGLDEQRKDAGISYSVSFPSEWVPRSRERGRGGLETKGSDLDAYLPSNQVCPF